MKIQTTVALALTASTAAAANWSPFGNQKPLAGTKDAEKVPGENPLEFCEETTDYTVKIKNVDLDPNPPAA